ncbi:MAG: protein-glutamate O-methyltransferase CheR [Candidatus Bathyarchaeota archaeon]|nr:protein-glutamate O-methyltransferase CheR [Candidatus Bathyarchaeota archaeon]
MSQKTSASMLMEDEHGFQLIKSQILKATGLNCAYYRENYLRRRIKFRMRKLGIESFWGYWRYLRSNENEYALLIRDLTINYSSFFRDPDVFLYFQDRILKEMLAKKRGLRILSAGCAKGEEPYTIGIAVNEALGSNLSNFRIVIYAIDIDNESLKKARIGEYSEKEVAGVNEHILKKYFTSADGKFTIKDSVRQLVRFIQADLTQKLVYGNLDIIFCRYVLIYFDKPGQKHIFKNFYDALTSDGYLILGKAELLPDGFHDKFRCINPELRIYRKVLNEA